MAEIRKHIAPFLFVIFSFPITFQPLHVVWHHSHGYMGRQLYLHPFSGENSNYISQKAELCPIGEYQFSVNDLPELFFFDSFKLSFSQAFNEKEIQQKHKAVFTEEPSRAPPVIPA